MAVSYDPTTSTHWQVYWPMMKVWQALNGIYVWEFIVTLDYEWRVIRGHLPYRWTIWVYSLSRVSALVGAILCLASMDVTTPLNCQLWMSFSAAFFYVSATSASLLIILRIIAIWNRNKFVVSLSFIIWVISAVLHMRNAILLRSVWVPAQKTCDPIHTQSSLLSFIPTIVSNMVLLLIMLAGLVILRHHDGGRFGLLLLLWQQGIIWLALATASEVPPLVLMALNLNNRLNIMLETPSLITTIMAATRMHRHLVNFVSKPAELEHENLKVSNLVFASNKPTDTTPTMLDRIEVTVHTAFEERSTAQMSDDGSSDTSTNEQASEIAGGTSKLDITQSSTHPLSTVSPSPQLAQSA